MPAIQGLRGTGEFSTDFRPKNYRELFTLLEPNGTAPLQALLSMTSSEATDDPEFKNFRDELPSRTVVSSAAYALGITSIVLTADTTNNAFVVPGTLIYNPLTSETMRVTAFDVATNTATVTRGIGSSAAAIASGQVLTLAGFADVEGGVSPTPMTWDATVASNYTQIFKTAIQLSDTLKNTKLRTGSKEEEMIMKGLKLHMGDIERSFFFGNKAEINGSTSQPLRTTGGLLSMIPTILDVSTNPFADGAGTISENNFDKYLIETIFAYGSSEKVAFCGPKVISHLQKLAKNRWKPTAVEGAYGVSMTRYSTFAGDLLVQLHPMFRQLPDMASAMVILDLPYVKYRFMNNRDTKLMKDIGSNDADGSKHQYLTEAGLELTQSKVHTVIKNWTAVTVA